MMIIIIIIAFLVYENDWKYDENDENNNNMDH